MTELKRCPCGKIPEKLQIYQHGFSSKYAQVYGSCCGFWETEFWLNYLDPNSPEALKQAEKEWNNTPRGFE